MKRILNMIVALLAIVSSATAQTLSIASVEVKEGGQCQRHKWRDGLAVQPHSASRHHPR